MEQPVAQSPTAFVKGPSVRYHPEVQELPVSRIRPGPYQAREEFDEAGLRELTRSIKQHGLLQPIVVCPSGDSYEVVAGERRLRACRLAGLSMVPAVVRTVSGADGLALGLVENLQRKDLSFLEEAAGYLRLSREFGLTQQEIALRVGKDQSTIANKLRLLKLSERVRETIAREKLSERHARALLRLPTERQQLDVLKEVVASRLTVSQTERLVGRWLAAPGPTRPRKQGQSLPRCARSGRVVWVIKDIRLYLNSIRSVIRDLQAAGIDVTYEEETCSDKVSLRIVIHVGSAPKRTSARRGGSARGAERPTAGAGLSPRGRSPLPDAGSG